MQQLHEKYRPRTWQDLIGQDKAARQVEALRNRGGLAGRAFWISGPSGTGKTTIARLIAAEVADDWLTEELDASELHPADLRRLEAQMQMFGSGKGGRAYIVNEAHGLRRDTVRQLLVLLERMPRHCVMIFTTTNDGQEALFEGTDDAGPLLSRCIAMRLTNQGLAQLFAERALEVARSEGLDGQPLKAYMTLVRDCRNNMRAVYQRIEAGEMIAG